MTHPLFCGVSGEHGLHATESTGGDEQPPRGQRGAHSDGHVVRIVLFALDAGAGNEEAAREGTVQATAGHHL